jgi:sulfate permease, SulP family
LEQKDEHRSDFTDSMSPQPPKTAIFLSASQARWWFFDYQAPWFRLDLIAGLTAAAVVLPKAMAYASVAGLPVQVGLYTALIPMAVYAVLGTSRPLSVSTTSTIAILTAAELALVAPSGSPGQLMTLAATLALIVGGTLVLASVLKLGFLANFISDPVLAGFKSGIGIIIIVDQIPKLLGVHIEKGSFLGNILQIAEHIPQTSLPTVTLALGTLAVILALERFARHVPAPLVAVAVGVILSAAVGLESKGIDTIGEFPGGLPSFSLPDLSLAGALLPGASGIALMSFIESITIGRSFARPGESRPQADGELFALGVANLGGAFFKGMPAGGGGSQTAVNYAAGARTQMAELVTAAVGLLTLLVLTSFIGFMPQATLAAVVLVATLGLVNPAEFISIKRIRPVEFGWALVSLMGVIFFGVLEGIFVAVCVSLLSLIYQANHPPVDVMGRKPGTDVFRLLSREHTGDETFPGLLILRTEGRVQFANAQRIGDKIWPLIHDYQPKVLLLDLSAVPDIEYTALKMLTAFEEKLCAMRITLWLAALNPSALEVVRRAPLGETLGNERMFFTVSLAVEKYLREEADAGTAQRAVREGQLV